MAIRQKKELLPTIKVKVQEGEELSVLFDDEIASNQYKIVGVKDQDTEFGEKTIMTLDCINDGNKYNVFVNATSLNLLVDKFGENDAKWIGEKVTLSKEKNSKYKNEMIVINPQ